MEQMATSKSTVAGVSHSEERSYTGRVGRCRVYIRSTTNQSLPWSRNVCAGVRALGPGCEWSAGFAWALQVQPLFTIYVLDHSPKA